MSKSKKKHVLMISDDDILKLSKFLVDKEFIRYVTIKRDVDIHRDSCTLTFTTFQNFTGLSYIDDIDHVFKISYCVKWNTFAYTVGDESQSKSFLNFQLVKKLLNLGYDDCVKLDVEEFKQLKTSAERQNIIRQLVNEL